MLTPQDTPTPADVLRYHQLQDASTCACGQQVGPNLPMAEHQLQVLAASDLAVVSIHGTAGVVRAAATVVGGLRAFHWRLEGPPELHTALRLLTERVEALGG